MNLITTRQGQIPIEEIKEGTEVLSMGKWVLSPKPIKTKCIQCSFKSLPTTCFQKEFIQNKQSVSACHNIILAKNNIDKPELVILGYFKNDKKCSVTVFKGLDSLTYWLPKFIKLYDEPILPQITDIGYNLVHHKKTFEQLEVDELSERNLEYILEGMLRKCFLFNNCKYHLPQITRWNEIHRIVIRLLDIECDVFQNNDVAIRNPVQLYRHIKDDYNKSKISDEEIVYNLKREYRLPEYTTGYEILKQTEVEDWILPNINPDVNTLNPDDIYYGVAHLYNKDEHYKNVT